MGYNCCGPEQEDDQDNRIDVMQEFNPGIRKRKMKKSKTEAETEADSSIADFLVPVKKSKHSEYSKGSKGSK